MAAADPNSDNGYSPRSAYTQGGNVGDSVNLPMGEAYSHVVYLMEMFDKKYTRINGSTVEYRRQDGGLQLMTTDHMIKMFGYTAQEWLKQNPSPLVPPKRDRKKKVSLSSIKEEEPVSSLTPGWKPPVREWHKWTEEELKPSRSII